MNIKKLIKKYAPDFSEENLWQKLQRFAKQAGVKVVYTVLLLFYAYKRKDTPRWAKTIVVGALGYFISPIDGLPDLTPIIGYTDDLGILSFGLVTIAAYINDEVREKARKRLDNWFKDYDEGDLEDVDNKL